MGSDFTETEKPDQYSRPIPNWFLQAKQHPRKKLRAERQNHQRDREKPNQTDHSSKGSEPELTMPGIQTASPHPAAGSEKMYICKNADILDFYMLRSTWDGETA